jgi:hypothetical protein
VVPAAATSRSTKAVKWRDETDPSSRLGDVASATIAMRWAALPKQRVRGCIIAIAEFACQPQAIAPRAQNCKVDATTEALFARCRCARVRTIGTRTLIAHIIGAGWKPCCDPSRPPPLLAHGLLTARRAPDTFGFLLAMSDVSTDLKTCVCIVNADGDLSKFQTMWCGCTEGTRVCCTVPGTNGGIVRPTCTSLDA